MREVDVLGFRAFSRRVVRAEFTMSQSGRRSSLCYADFVVVAAGVSFLATSRILRDLSDITWVSQVSLGISDLQFADCSRSTVAFVLQAISDVLCSCWSFSVAFDVATAHTTSYFDVRVRAYFDGEIQNLQFIANPMTMSYRRVHASNF
jgi:hypothetical protein